MTYVALLRGINVGGNNTISMARLKVAFEELGFGAVRTYINSGNILFDTDDADESELVGRIEEAIFAIFALRIPVVLRSRPQLEAVVRATPKEWTNDTSMRTEVMFLWDEVDRDAVLDEIMFNVDVDRLVYVPGAVVWNVLRSDIAQSKLRNLIGTRVYKLMTGRNITTVRKLHQLMSETAPI